MASTPFKARNNFFALSATSISSGTLAIVALLTLIVGGMTYVTVSELRKQAHQTTLSELSKAVKLVASQSELALQDNDLPRLRRLLLDTQATGLYHRLSINFANNQTLVSTDINESYRTTLPDSWGVPAVPFESKSRFNKQIEQFTLSEPLKISKDASAVLIAESMPVAQSTMLWRFELAAALTAPSGLVLGILAFLQTRQRPGPINAIRNALARYAQGQTSTPDLLVASNLGHGADTFNQLLEERDELLTKLTLFECENSIAAVSADSFGLSSVCSSLTQGMVVLDTNLNIQFINGSAAAYLRIDSATSIGKNIKAIDPDSILSPTATKALNPESPRRLTAEIELEQSATTLRCTFARIPREDDTLCLIYIEDITQQRHADEALNSFIAQATHELRTPLTNIRLYAEEAIDAGSEDEEFRSNAFNMINSESRRLERLVSDMLCVSELEAGSMNIRKDTVRPEAMFEELERDYKPQAEAKGINIVFDLPPKFPTLEADRDRLGQGIHNLIGNALKYTPSGGAVTVKVEFDPSDAMTVRISDTGIGISMEDQSRIFERFCRAQDQRIESISGTGLGLAITSEIVKMHGGQISVESELDQGSTFILTVPSGRSSMKSAA